MRRSRAFFYALMILAIGLGVVVAFVVDGTFAGSVEAPPLRSGTSQANISIAPFSYRYAGRAVLQIDYHDNRSLPINATWTNGRPVNQGTLTNPGMERLEWSEYGGAGGIVGSYGTFRVIPIRNTVTGDIVVRFHGPRASSAQVIDWETAEILTTPRTHQTSQPIEGGGHRHDMRIRFDRIGTYQVTIRSSYGGNIYVNEYQIVITRGRLGTEVNIGLNRTPMALRLNNDAETITLRATVSGATMEDINPTFSLAAGSVTLYSVVDSVRVGENVLNEFFIPTLQNSNREIVLTRREGYYLPTGYFQINTIITYQFTTVDNSGIHQQYSSIQETRWLTVYFREPAVSGGFQWWILLLGIAVLGLLAGGIYASNWLIAYSQQQNSAKRSERMAVRTVRDIENMMIMQEQLDAQEPAVLDFDDVLSEEEIAVLQYACDKMVNPEDYMDEPTEDDEPVPPKTRKPKS